MTAKEIAESIQYDIQYWDEGGFLGIDTELLAEKLVEFAKYHAEKMAQRCWEASRIKIQEPDTTYLQEEILVNSINREKRVWISVDEASIKNAYPLENIK